MPLGLQPSEGEIYGHLFENSATGLRRGVYWNARIDFEPVSLDGEEQDCSLSIEWLALPVRRWRDLDGVELARVTQPDLIECSLYLFEEHNRATLRRLQLRKTGPSSFEADFLAIADVDDGSGRRLFEVSGRCDLSFTSIIVVPSNLQPEPASELEVQAVLVRFISLEDLSPPLSEGWRYVLEPTAG